MGATIILSGGTFAPGPSGTPGTMTVTGNLAFQSGALYVVQVNPTTASTTNVSGTASLAGTVQANFLPGSFIERSYTILTAAGGRSRHVRRSDYPRPTGELPDEPELYRQYRSPQPDGPTRSTAEPATDAARSADASCAAATDLHRQSAQRRQCDR